MRVCVWTPIKQGPGRVIISASKAGQLSLISIDWNFFLPINLLINVDVWSPCFCRSSRPVPFHFPFISFPLTPLFEVKTLVTKMFCAESELWSAGAWSPPFVFPSLSLFLTPCPALGQGKACRSLSLQPLIVLSHTAWA